MDPSVSSRANYTESDTFLRIAYNLSIGPVSSDDSSEPSDRERLEAQHSRLSNRVRALNDASKGCSSLKAFLEKPSLNRSDLESLLDNESLAWYFVVIKPVSTVSGFIKNLDDHFLFKIKKGVNEFSGDAAREMHATLKEILSMYLKRPNIYSPKNVQRYFKESFPKADIEKTSQFISNQLKSSLEELESIERSLEASKPADPIVTADEEAVPPTQISDDPEEMGRLKELLLNYVDDVKGGEFAWTQIPDELKEASLIFTTPNPNYDLKDDDGKRYLQFNEQGLKDILRMLGGDPIISETPKAPETYEPSFGEEKDKPSRDLSGDLTGNREIPRRKIEKEISDITPEPPKEPAADYDRSDLSDEEELEIGDWLHSVVNASPLESPIISSKEIPEDILGLIKRIQPDSNIAKNVSVKDDSVDISQFAQLIFWSFLDSAKNNLDKILSRKERTTIKPSSKHQDIINVIPFLMKGTKFSKYMSSKDGKSITITRDGWQKLKKNIKESDIAADISQQQDQQDSDISQEGYEQVDQSMIIPDVKTGVRMLLSELARILSKSYETVYKPYIDGAVVSVPLKSVDIDGDLLTEIMSLAKDELKREPKAVFELVGEKLRFNEIGYQFIRKFLL